MGNRCYNCKFWATVDSGYSNYTVLETTVHCLKSCFKPIEESYSWREDKNNPENDSEFFKKAENCIHFVREAGVQIQLDVEGDVSIEDCKEDDEVYQAAINYDWDQV